LAHELAHFLLGHDNRTQSISHETNLSLAQPPPYMPSMHIISSHNNLDEQDQIEIEANIFARRLLSPACVIWALGISTPRDIADICGIPLSEAIHRAKRMKVLYQREMFLTDEMEKRLYEQFSLFIKEKGGK
jgi:Zn-dependent peptidase ImmA (M78 family)